MSNKVCEDGIIRQIERIEKALGEALEPLKDGALEQKGGAQAFLYHELNALSPLAKQAREGLLSVEEFSQVAGAVVVKLNAVKRFGGPFDVRFVDAVERLRKILVASDRGNRSAVLSALAISDEANSLTGKLGNFRGNKKWEFFEFYEKAYQDKRIHRAGKKTNKKDKKDKAEKDNDNPEVGEVKFADLVDDLKESAQDVQNKANDLADDLLGCPDCDELCEDREELEEALSDLRCLYCFILCEVDLLEGAEQPAFQIDLRNDLADLGVSIELMQWQFDKINLQKQTVYARATPILAKIRTGIDAIKSAFSKAGANRLDGGVAFNAATNDISSQFQQLSSGISKLGASETCEMLSSQVPLVDALSQSFQALYCKKPENIDKEVFFYPWSLLVQLRCLLEPCCEGEDECDDLKKQLSRFFCLWQGLSGQFKDVNCDTIFDRDWDKECCCQPATSTSGATASVAAAPGTASSMSSAQVTATIQQLQQMIAQAKTQSLLSPAQVDSLNKMLPAGTTVSSPVVLANVGSALQVYLNATSDQKAQLAQYQGSCNASGQQSALADLRQKVSQTLQGVQGIN